VHGVSGGTWRTRRDLTGGQSTRDAAARPALVGGEIDLTFSLAFA
jgi:hypothetical protein